MTIKLTFFSVLLILFSYCPISLADIPLHRYPIIANNDYVCCATDVGLYRYDKRTGEWLFLSARQELAGKRVQTIGLDEDMLWVGLEDGVLSADIRTDDWVLYTDADGLPSNDVKRLAFQQDYVWVATAAGAAQFDKFVEEWTSFKREDSELISDQINDVAVQGDNVWFATAKGINRYDAQNESWQSYPQEMIGLPTDNVQAVLPGAGLVWFVTGEGLVKYDEVSESWTVYRTEDGLPSYNINDVKLAGRTLWLATDAGILNYDANADNWTEFLPLKSAGLGVNVQSIALDGNQIWVATRAGLIRIDKGSGRWRKFFLNDGLVDKTGYRLAVSGNVVFLVGEEGISVFDKTEQTWRGYEYKTIGTQRSEAGGYGFRLDSEGIGFDLPGQSQVRLRGTSSSTLRADYDKDFGYAGKNTTSHDAWNSLTLSGRLPGKRLITGFYDDIVEEDKQYLATYRGTQTDFLREATFGELHVKALNSDIIEDVSLSGGGGRFSFEKNRLNTWYGQRRGRYQSDFFRGRIAGREAFSYQLSHQQLIPNTDEVWVDDELLQRNVHYTVDYRLGWIIFQQELIDPDSEIRVSYQYEGDADDDVLMFQSESAISDERMLLNSNIIGFWGGGEKTLIGNLGNETRLERNPIKFELYPELAYSRINLPRSDENALASHVKFVARTSALQIRGDYRDYDDDFPLREERNTEFGTLKRRWEISSRSDFPPAFPITLRWERERSRSETGESIKEDEATGKLVFSKNPYPLISLKGKYDRITSPASKQSEATGRIGFQYEVPKRILSSTRIKKLRLTANYRGTTQTSEAIENSSIQPVQTDTTQSSEDTNRLRHSGYLGIKLTPIDQFVINAYNQATELKQKKHGKFNLQFLSKRLVVASNFNSIPGLISTFQFDDSYTDDRIDTQKIDEDRFLTLNFGLRPGIWLSYLDMLNVIGGYGQTKQRTAEGDIARTIRSKSLYLQPSLRPHRQVDWVGNFSYANASADEDATSTIRRRYASEITFQPNSANRIIFDYAQDFQRETDTDLVMDKKEYNPLLWWESQRSPRLTTRLQLSYRRDLVNGDNVARAIAPKIQRQEAEPVENTKNVELTPGLSFRYYLRSTRLGLKSLYLTSTFSVAFGSRQRDNTTSSTRTYSNSLLLEWKVSANFVSRLNLFSTYRQDSQNDDSFSLKFVGRASAVF